MKLIKMKCPNCGAELDVDADQKMAVCEYCDTKFLIEDDQKVLSNAEESDDKATSVRKGKKKFARLGRGLGTCCLVFVWIIFFPIAFTVWAVRNKDMKKPLKIALVTGVWILFIALFGAGSGSTASSNSKTDSMELAVTESTTNAESETDSIEESADSEVLQMVFSRLSATVTTEDIQNLASSNELKYTQQELGGNPQQTVYKLALSDGVAAQKYADIGDYLEVTFNKDDGSLMFAEYYCSMKGSEALFYQYGVYGNFNFSTGSYSGYYYHSDSDTSNDGITLKLENGNSVQTSYIPCGDAEEAIRGAVSSQ